MRKHIYCLLLFAFPSCNGQKDIETKLVGEWLSYRTENFIGDKNDLFGKGDSIQTFYSVKQRWEFNRGGTGRQLTNAPEVFSFTYKVEDSVLLFWNRKYKIERITTDTLVMLEFERSEIYLEENNPYSDRIHLRRVK